MPTTVSLSADVEEKLLTDADFLDWLEPGRFADLIDGEIAMHSPVSIGHADLLNFVDRLLARYIEDHDLGYLYREVVAVRLGSRNVFLPDLSFYRKERSGVIHDTYLDGAPDLVIEALSPRTAHRDVGSKFAEYEEHGVGEYWVLDPHTHAHRFYRRDGEILVEYGSEADRIESNVVSGFFLIRDWLHPDRRPATREALAAIEAEGGPGLRKGITAKGE